MSESVDSVRRSRPLAFVANLVTLAAVFAVGLGGGMLAASQGGGEEEHEHEAHAEAPAKPKLSPRTLENLGITVEPVGPGPFVRTLDVPAVIVLPPNATRPVYAPVAGLVTKIDAVPGARVEAGEVIAEVLRDPWPRPTLTLTDPVLGSLTEEFGRAVADLRSAAQAAAIAREELQRVRGLTGSAAGGGAPIAGKVAIDLDYEQRKTERALESARSEALRHGLTTEEIAAVEAGRPAPEMPDPRRVLERSRLWSPQADEVLPLLPPEIRGRPYAIAVLGELAGSGTLTREWVSALQTHPRLAAAFLEVAGLVQQGITVPGLLHLEAIGALEPIVPVRAPEDAPDYDVSTVDLRAGARVAAGDPVVDLLDQRIVYLRIAPSGSEVEGLAQALANHTSLDAEPLAAGAGPRLHGLTLLRLAPGEEGAAHGAALATAENVRLCEPRAEGGEECRSWQLRPGVRYLVKVPIETYPDVYVLPADAITERGPDSVLHLEDGDSFRAVPVRVLHHDSRVVVVANDGAVFPGDRIVTRGAYALSLALQAASGGGEGGGHHHHHH
jgi:multidrug efflux pump subunit AcrA (membrane-fusion protein)